MKAITVRAPYSQIIAEAAALAALDVAPKLIENRGQRIGAEHIGADIAIHAGATWSTTGAADPRVRHAWARFAAAIHPLQANPHLAAIGDTRTGVVGGLRPGLWIEERAVVAVATLVGCHQAAGGCCQPWGEMTHNGKPAWHLELDNVRRLVDPVPARGWLTVPWALPADVEAAVLAQLKVASDA
jgi:hypothetical protein